MRGAVGLLVGLLLASCAQEEPAPRTAVRGWVATAERNPCRGLQETYCRMRHACAWIGPSTRADGSAAQAHCDVRTAASSAAGAKAK